MNGVLKFSYDKVIRIPSIIAAIIKRGMTIRKKIFNDALILSRLNFLTFLSRIKKIMINGVMKRILMNIKIV